MGGQKKNVFHVESKAPDGRTVTEALDVRDRRIAWNANSIQMEAAIAAADVQKAGGSVEEMLEAARKAANDKGGIPDPLPEASGRPDGVVPQLDRFHRWMLAVARLGSGRFDGLSKAELLDVVCLVQNPVTPFDQWQELIGLAENAGNPKE